MNARFSAALFAALGVMHTAPAVDASRDQRDPQETGWPRPTCIVTILDTVQDACYLLFQVEPKRTAVRRFDSTPSDVQSAAAVRDHQLAELNDTYEQGFKSLYPGTPPLSLLRFQWEGWKVQNEYDRVVRENELAWLEGVLDRIAAAPSVAVSGPVPCGARPQKSSSTNNRR